MTRGDSATEILKGLAKIASVILAAALFGLVMLYYRTGTIFPQLDQPGPEETPRFIIRGIRLAE